MEIITPYHVCSVPGEEGGGADIMSTVGEYLEYHGGNLEYHEGYSVLWGKFWEFVQGVDYLMLRIR